VNRVIWLVVTVSAFAGRLAAQVTCPPPSGRLITVSPGVRIEVVEWSQKGEPLFFLSGMGRTAHAFDRFAPVFARQYRVVGITRRGWGRSSPSPGCEYGSTVLLRDNLAVMDSLRVGAAHVAGWSFGGHEATLLAARSTPRGY
jgi:pimeloyl-ACP methyl ester carboxylesterase